MNVAVEHHPDYVVHATSADDVRATVRTAQRFGLPVTVFSTGHGFARGIDGGIALSTAGLTGVEVDEPARTARIAAGSRWRDVLDVVTPLGLAAVTGSSPDVGAVGFLLGGGIGPLAREVGFGSNYLVAADLVTGDGTLLHVDDEHHPEILRALRGGKWGLGVVTSVTVRLLNLETVTGGNFFALGDDAATLFRTYADWVQGAPSDITTSIALLRLPPLEFLPEPLRGQYVANVRVASTRPLAEVERAIAPLRTAVPILMDSIAEIPYAAIGGVHADPTDPMPILDGSTLLHTFEPRTAEAVLAVAGPQSQAPLMRPRSATSAGRSPTGRTAPTRSRGATPRSRSSRSGSPSPSSSRRPSPQRSTVCSRRRSPGRSDVPRRTSRGRSARPHRSTCGRRPTRRTSRPCAASSTPTGGSRCPCEAPPGGRRQPTTVTRPGKSRGPSGRKRPSDEVLEWEIIWRKFPSR